MNFIGGSDMKMIYMDNAATSFPKAPGTAESMLNYMNNVGCNVNRGAYMGAYEAERVVFETRELICKLFNFDKPENVIFTKNITESLNVLIKGMLKPGDHVIISSMEHNAVLRPLYSMASGGIEISRIPCRKDGSLDPMQILPYIKQNTKAIFMTHASNVCGTIMPLLEVGRICREKNIFFIVDSAQTAGFLNIDFKDLNADAIAFTGHKGLLGPQGMGGFMINDRLNECTRSFIEGGTGSYSDHEDQPSIMPDKFESGTMNIPGIYGLNNSLKYVMKTGIDAIREKEMELTKIFIDGILNTDGVEIAGIKEIEGRTAVVSLNFNTVDNAEAAQILTQDFGIMTRCGLHCAASAHKTLGTFPVGTVRFSFSHFNTEDEITYALDSIQKCIKMN